MRIVCCQMLCVTGDAEGNIARAVASVREAIASEPDMIILPEAWATGFALDDMNQCVAATPRALDALRDAAGDWAGLLVAGSLFVRDGDAFFNEMTVLRRGETVATCRKLHLFEGLGEHEALTPGEVPVVLETPMGTAGLAICYDLRFPELFRWHSRRGAVLLVLPAQWPLPRIAHWRLLVQARAVENVAFIAGVNVAGHAEINRLHGHSMVVDPWGEILWEAGQEPAVGVVDLDLARLREARAKISAVGEFREDLIVP